VLSQLRVVVVIEAREGVVVDVAVQSLDLAFCPGVVRLGQPIFDLMLAADAVEDVLDQAQMYRFLEGLVTRIQCGSRRVRANSNPPLEGRGTGPPVVTPSSVVAR
jgi:hypothetical protein